MKSQLDRIEAKLDALYDVIKTLPRNKPKAQITTKECGSFESACTFIMKKLRDEGGSYEARHVDIQSGAMPFSARAYTRALAFLKEQGVIIAEQTESPDWRHVRYRLLK